MLVFGLGPSEIGGIVLRRMYISGEKLFRFLAKIGRISQQMDNTGWILHCTPMLTQDYTADGVQLTSLG